MKKYLLGFCGIATSVLALSSCSNDYKAEVTRQFNDSIKTNAAATSHIMWEVSPNNSINIFKKINENYLLLPAEKKAKFTSSVCEGLKELSNQNLAVFKDELHKPENTTVIGATCQQKLVDRLKTATAEDIVKFDYKTNPEDLTYSKPIDFKLESKIVTLDKPLTTKEMIEQLNDGEIVLTFDDGPGGPSTDSILKTLEQAGDVKAMFFTNGKNIEKYSEKIEAEFKNGHVVANHSWNHFCLGPKPIDGCAANNMGNKEYKRLYPEGTGLISDSDLLKNEIFPNFEIIKKYVGQIAPFFRFPFGAENDPTLEYFKNHGIYSILWNIDTNDWKRVQNLGTRIQGQTSSEKIIEQVPFTPQDIIDSAVRQIKTQKKGIILFHDIHTTTAEILPQFLYELHKLNFKVVQFKAKPIDTL